MLNKLRIKYKILLSSLIPVGLICIVAILISNTVVKNKLLEDAKSELRASADLLPQSCSMKNGKYIQYSRIFHTFARVKTLAESPCPIMRCCPKGK